jgi:hypothetical protein
MFHCPSRCFIIHTFDDTYADDSAEMHSAWLFSSLITLGLYSLLLAMGHLFVII